MSRREFSFYIVSGDKQSEQLVRYFHDNMAVIKKRGFPLPSFKKLTKKQVSKNKEQLMSMGIRILPCIMFNTNLYSGDEIYSLLRTDLNKMKNKPKQEEQLENYYSAASDDYFAMMGMTTGSSKNKGSNYTSEEEEPFTESSLKEVMAKQEQNRRRPEMRANDREEIRGNTVDDNDSEIEPISEEEPVKPTKKASKKASKKTSQKNYGDEDYESLDAYYASLALKDGGASDGDK